MASRRETAMGTTTTAVAWKWPTVVAQKRHRSGGTSFTGKLKWEETKCENSQRKKKHHHVQISPASMELTDEMNDKTTSKNEREKKNKEEKKRKT